MKVIARCACLTIFTVQVAFAAPTSGFSCERIKEKAVREACIEDRTDKEAAENAEKGRAAAEEETAAEKGKQERDLIAQKKKKAPDFVVKSTRIVVGRLKDPASAKFTKLRIAKSGGQQLVCGTVNARDPDDGYVGAKDFYVLWTDGAGTSPEVYMDGDIAAKAEARMGELMQIIRDRSSGISAKIGAADEGDRVEAQAKRDIARASQILSKRCNQSATAIDGQYDLRTFRCRGAGVTCLDSCAPCVQ